MSDFKAPDVVYTDKASLVLANAKGHTSLGLIVTNSATARLFSYTLTTTAEENARKAVREALEKVKAEFIVKSEERLISENEDFSAFDYSGGNYDDAYYQGCDDGEICKSREVVERIDQLLAQYQDPKPTEASNE